VTISVSALDMAVPLQRAEAARPSLQLASQAQTLTGEGAAPLRRLAPQTRAALDAAFAPRAPTIVRSGTNKNAAGGADAGAPGPIRARRSSVSGAAASIAAERRKSVVFLAGAAAASRTAAAAAPAPSAAAAVPGGRKAGSSGAPPTPSAEAGLGIRNSCTAVEAAQGHLIDSLHGMRTLMAETGFARRELAALFVRFQGLCALSSTPRGVDVETFRRHIPALAVEDSAFAERVFDLMDRTGNGFLEWHEFVMGMASLEKASPVARAAFLFRAHDVRAAEALSRQDFFRFFASTLAPLPHGGDFEPRAPLAHGVDEAAEAAAAAAAEAAALRAAGDPALWERREVLRELSDQMFDELDVKRTGRVKLQDVLDALERDDARRHADAARRGRKDAPAADPAALFGRALVDHAAVDVGKLVAARVEAQRAAAARSAMTRARSRESLYSSLSAGRHVPHGGGGGGGGRGGGEGAAAGGAAAGSPHSPPRKQRLAATTTALESLHL
jgi:hypothetical protein